jgi:hypothetical protein
MNSEHLKIAFMRGVQAADREAGVTLQDHMGMLKTAIGWGALALPALGAGVGAMSSPGEEVRGAMGGGMAGLGAYALLRTAGGLGKGIGRRLIGRGAAAAAKAAPAVAEKVAPAASKALSPAWKSGLLGAGIGTGLGVGGYSLLSPSGVSPEEQQLLDQYRMQQMQSAPAGLEEQQ